MKKTTLALSVAEGKSPKGTAKQTALTTKQTNAINGGQKGVVTVTLVDL